MTAEASDIGTAPASASRFTLSQVSTLLGVLGLAFLLGIAAYVAWNERRILFGEGRDRAEQEAYFLAEHAQRLFEVSDVALRATEAAAAGKDWTAVEQSPDILSAMREVDEMLPYVDAVFLADATGLVRRTTLTPAPAAYSIADRTVFKEAASGRGGGLLISDPVVGHVSGRTTFLIARRLEMPDGTFRGVVGVAMSLDYFTQFWARLDKRNDERIVLLRAGDGAVLARFPPEPRRPDSNGLISRSVIEAAGRQPLAGIIAPTAEDSGSYHRVGDLPAYVAVVYRNAEITRQWMGRLATVLPFFFFAAAAMGSVLLLGRRIGRREAAARRSIEGARALLAASNVRLEQRVTERTAALQESNEEIQRFAYIVSHDLRAPLVNIMGFTTELADLRETIFASGGPREAETVAAARADFDEALGFIQSSIDKMDRLIKAILGLSRQGQRRLRPEPLDMDVLMRSIADGVAHRVMQSGTSVVIGPLPPLVADRIAVEQIFSNLIDNAVKYLRPDVPGRIEVTGQASATTVTYEVRDNGRGIDEKDHERVFELFRRAGRQDQPGEGIGLANVRSLVRRLGGTITLDSQLGLGCAFTVILPKFGADGETR